MAEKRALITDYVHSNLIDGLERLGYRTTYAPDITLDQVHDFVDIYDGLVVNTKIKCDESLLANGKKLHWIARLGSGLDIIDLSKAAALDIQVFSAPEGNRNAVAEHALGMILCLANKINIADREVKCGWWLREKNRGFELDYKKVGIIGFGNNGSAFAGKFGNWKTQILSYDKYKLHYTDHYRFVREVQLADIQQEADIISLHVPLTEETHYMVDDDFISRCKDGFILINTSRGKVVDTKALINGLKRGKIKGACLDVLENEKPWNYSDREKEMYRQLYEMDNVILTPHVAGWTFESKRKIADTLISKINKNV